MTLSAEERGELESAARSLLARHSSSDRVRTAISNPPGFDRELWDAMVEVGWTTIHVPEAHGGAGCGYADLAIVLHELGRALTPSPFLASAVLASGALMLADNAALRSELLASLTEGQALGAVALAGTNGSYDLGRLTTGWRSEDGAVRLFGQSGFVLDADVADVIIVAARDKDGMVTAVTVDANATGVRIDRSASVDETRRLFTISFDDVVIPASHLLCEPGTSAAALLDHVLALGTVAAACDATGVAEHALERTAEYARERQQFGKPIGSFQGVKHHCANMAIAVEASHSATRAAAAALDTEPARWARTAAITSSYVGPACAQTCALALLVHGGIGFTWEHDAHLFLKRAKLDEVLFGTPSWHRRRLADEVFPALVAS